MKNYKAYLFSRFFSLSLLFLMSCGSDSSSLQEEIPGAGAIVTNPSEEQKGEDGAYKAYSFYDRAFPDDNVWNQDISDAPVDPNSDLYISSLGKTGTLHADFGTLWDGQKLGMPINVVNNQTVKVPVSFLYANSSDPGPYPIPKGALIQHSQNSTGDRHVIVVDTDKGMLYEMYRAFPNSNGSWKADSGAVFDLKTNARRPDHWTSADAAGLPIFPALVRYHEVVEQGEIRHALRMSANKTRRAYVFPATHQAGSSTSTSLPPMGARLRLKANFDISKYSPNVQVILRALKQYGMFIADNGVSWQITGEHHMSWNDQELQELRKVSGAAFEVILMPPLKYTPW